MRSIRRVMPGRHPREPYAGARPRVRTHAFGRAWHIAGPGTLDRIEVIQIDEILAPHLELGAPTGRPVP
jgi:hypothetical protein